MLKTGKRIPIKDAKEIGNKQSKRNNLNERAMTAKDFREECELGYNHFQELTSTGIKPNYNNIERFAEEYHQAKIENLGLFNVSKRSELLKMEHPERSFDEYLDKYFSEPKAELIYKSLHDGKEKTEKEVIEIYKQAHRL